MSSKSIQQPTESRSVGKKDKREESLVERHLTPDRNRRVGKGASKTVFKTITPPDNSTVWPTFNTKISTPIVAATQEALTKIKRDEMIDEIMLQKELAIRGLAPVIYSVFVEIIFPDGSVDYKEYSGDRIIVLKAELDKHSPDAKMVFSIYEEECDGGDLKKFLEKILSGKTNIETIKGMLKSVDQQVINLIVEIAKAGYINTDFKTENTCVILPRFIALDFSRVFVISIDEIIGKALAKGDDLNEKEFIKKSLLYMRIQYYVTFITNFYRFNQMDYRKILGTVLTEKGVTEASVNDMVDYMVLLNGKNIFQHYPGVVANPGIDANPFMMLSHYLKYFAKKYLMLNNSEINDESFKNISGELFKQILTFAIGLRDTIDSSITMRDISNVAISNMDISKRALLKLAISKMGGPKMGGPKMGGPKMGGSKKVRPKNHNKASRLRRSRKVKSLKSI